LISYFELLSAETTFGVDFDGNNVIGIPFLGSVITAGEVTFGTTAFGYGFKSNDNARVVLILNALNPGSGEYASASAPGQGWIGAGLSSVSSTKFQLFWKNTISEQYARWDVDLKGVASNGVLISSAEFVAATSFFKTSAAFSGVSIEEDTPAVSRNVIYLASGVSLFLIGAISAVLIIRKRRRSSAANML
jgi:hypothetical protein